MVLRDLIESGVGAGGAADRGLPPGGPQPDHHQCAPDQRGPDAGAAEPGTPSQDFYFVEREEPERIADTLVELVKRRIPAKFKLDPIRDIQVLSPDEPRFAGHPRAERAPPG